jgi:hypothetical protein
LRLLYLLLTLLVLAFIAVLPAQALRGLTNKDIIKMQLPPEMAVRDCDVTSGLINPIRSTVLPMRLGADPGLK